jgi:TolB-like protein/Tfp pilus assembly protein PilF
LLTLLLVALAASGAWMWRAAAGDGQPVAGAQPMPDRPSIAVLAFRDPGGDAAAQQLARGVAADLISQLARNVDLRVVASASSFALAGQPMEPSEVARRLRSRYLVDGTVQRQGERLRVAIEMLDSEDGHVVWSTQHLVDHLNLLATRDALVQRIAGTLHTRLRQTEERRMLARPPRTLDVYTMTLRAIALKHQFRPEATREARLLLEQAIAIDPQYAPAWLYLGMLNGIDSAQQLTGEWHPGRYEEMLAQSRRAIELDPQLPAAYFGLALVHVEGRRFDAALSAMQRCLELGPNDADCLMYLAVVQSRMGLGAQAQDSIDRALDLNPLPPVYVNAVHAQVLWANRRLDEALRVASECIDKAPRYLVCRRVKLQSLVELARLAEAREEGRAILRQTPAATAEWFESHYAEQAIELRGRAMNAAMAAGLTAGALISKP